MTTSGRRTALLIVGTGLTLLVVLRGPVYPTWFPAEAAATEAPQPNQLVGVTMAKGIKSGSLFGQGEVTPVEPTTSFINTDLPYAVVRVKKLQTETVVTLRVSDPAGPAFSIDAKTPQHRNTPWESFDFALPLYILGTDLETRTGPWTLQVLFNGQAQSSTEFQWQLASPIALSKIRDQVNLSPQDPDLRWRYGAALALLHHEQEGIDELQNAIRLDRRYALYYITLGRVYERQGHPADAIRMFQTALSLHGSYYDAVYAGWAQAHLARLQAH